MSMSNSEELSDISGDDSVPYVNWKAYETAVKEGEEETPIVVKAKGRSKIERKYDFNVDKALDSIDLTFPNYTPSAQANEFFSIIRVVMGEDFEVNSSIMQYFLVDLVFGNVTREMFPYSPEINARIRLNKKMVAIIASRFSAKALTLDSKIMTPSGHITMIDSVVGDVVLDRNGKKCKIIAKSEVFNKPVYKMTLMDGRVIKMSEDHENIVWKRKRRMVKGENRCINSSPSGYKEVVMTAKELYLSGVTTNRIPKKEVFSNTDYKYWIPAPGDLRFDPSYSEGEFGFDPYTTGVILGDGSTDKKTGYIRITSHIDDVPNYMEHIPYTLGTFTKKYIDGVETPCVMFGLPRMGKSILKHIGCERSSTKRVPTGLLNGSVYQRTEVLMGLMDTDGTVDKKGCCSFTSTSVGLAEDVQYLIQSLGGSAFISKHEISSPFGMSWSVRIIINKIIFKLARKSNRQRITTNHMRTAIKSIELIESEPTQCITVDSPTKSFLTDGHTVTHNSTIITAFIPIYVAITGNFPGFGKVMFWVSFGDSQQAGAKVQANTIRDICEDSEFCKDYFEKMRFTDEECEFIRKGDGKVKDRAFMFKVKGAAGGSVRGIRYKTVRPQIFTFDDIIKSEADANSQIIMTKLRSMIYSDAEKALGKSGKIIIVNTPFNKKDPVYSALENGVWTPIAIPICEKIDMDTTKEEYVGSWEAMKSYEEVMEAYENSHYGQTIREFNQEYMLRISSEEDRMIPDHLIQWFDRTLTMKALQNYSLYITTDFTTTTNSLKDFSALGVWAVSSNGDWLLLDLCVKRQGIGEQYDELFRMIRTWSGKGATLEVGIEVDGQQRAHIHALKLEMNKRNLYFTLARQRGSKFGFEGVLSKNQGKDKHSRFRMILPQFQNKKIYFAEQLKDTPDMIEALQQLAYTTHFGFGSGHDDFNDLISMMGAIEIVLPLEDTSTNSSSRGRQDSIWDDIYEEEGSAYDSYS
jgi:phage terminase large subunit-like protein